MPEYVQILGNIIRRARLEAGLTQYELAERVGIDPRTILKIENHKGNPKMEVLYPLIRALNIDPNLIFYPESHHASSVSGQFQAFLSQCTEEELHGLYQVSQSVLSVLREGRPLETDK